MEQFQGACLVVEPIIREGIDYASQEKGQSCLFFLERYRERSTSPYIEINSCYYSLICIRPSGSTRRKSSHALLEEFYLDWS